MITSQELDKIRDQFHREIVRASILTTADSVGELLFNKVIPIKVTYHNRYDETYGVHKLDLIGVDTLTGELIVRNEDGDESTIYYNDLSLEQLAKVYEDIVIHKSFTINTKVYDTHRTS